MTLYKAIPLALGLSLAALAFAQAAEDTCTIPQSPRNIKPTPWPGPYNDRSHTSIVSHVMLPSIVYTPRDGGAAQRLRLCGQHYHFPIENPQGCVAGKAQAAGESPRPGDWVEIHTVYAAKLRTEPCNPESLDCCLEGPFVVRAFEARVTAGGSPTVIVPPPGRPLAEWTGSTTGKSEPGECKPEAQWSFRLGCGFTVSKAQLALFEHPDPARPVQPPNRLSKDLTLVVP